MAKEVIYYEDRIRKGHVHDYAEIATVGHVTRARVTQIMNVRLLAPDTPRGIDVTASHHQGDVIFLAHYDF